MLETVSTDNENSESVSRKAISCLAWLVLFGLIGGLALTGVMSVVRNSCSQEEQRSHALMAEQMEQIERGEINCLVQPDPRFIDELLADAACTANIRDLYLGCDLSDQRLGRLCELPNLKCIVFLFAENAEVFLERFQGNVTVEELTFDHSYVSDRGIKAIASLPNLKSLCLPLNRSKSGHMQGLANHPAIENLYLTVAGLDESLIPVLQTLLRLHRVMINTDKGGESGDPFVKSLREALPHCECRVTNVGR
jgi:hypothetical protein